MSLTLSKSYMKIKKKKCLRTRASLPRIQNFRSIMLFSSRQNVRGHSSTACSQKTSWKVLEECLWQENCIECTPLGRQICEQQLGIVPQCFHVQLFDLSILPCDIFLEGINNIRINAENPRVSNRFFVPHLGSDVGTPQIMLDCLKSVIIATW